MLVEGTEIVYLYDYQMCKLNFKHPSQPPHSLYLCDRSYQF